MNTQQKYAAFMYSRAALVPAPFPSSPSRRRDGYSGKSRITGPRKGALDGLHVWPTSSLSNSSAVMAEAFFSDGNSLSPHDLSRRPTVSTIQIHMKPEAWARARREGNMYFNTDKMSGAKKRVSDEWRLHSREVLTGAIRLYVKAEYAPPPSWSKRRRDQAIGKPKTTKPDADNVYKLVADALNGVAYTDDALVADGRFSKTYGHADSLTITVEPMETGA